jgi:asparagine synthase (glutamine-hydrolysing)
MAFPPRYKLRNGEGKYILKKIAEAFLPNEIVYRKKMGFPVPTANWFRGDLLPGIENTIAGLRSEIWFCPKSLADLISRHKAGIEDHSKLLMTLLVIAEWRRQYA